MTPLTAADFAKVQGTGYGLGTDGDLWAIDFEAAAGQAPVQLTAGTYDAVMLVALAAVAAGTDDPSRTDIQAALQTINDPTGTVVSYGGYAAGVAALNAGTPINYEGVSGSLDFSGDRNAVVSPLDRWRIENGAFVFTPIQ